MVQFHMESKIPERHQPAASWVIHSKKLIESRTKLLTYQQEIKLQQLTVDIALLHHDLCWPARTVDMVPGIKNNTLISTSKFVDANYISIFDQEEVNLYDANTTKITVSHGSVLKGWRDWDGLWWIPLVPHVKNNNTETIVVNEPPSHFLPNRPKPSEAIHNVYKLTTKAEIIQYYHAAAGFPTEATWLKAIKNGNYTAWPGLSAAEVKKTFPRVRRNAERSHA